MRGRGLVSTRVCLATSAFAITCIACVDAPPIITVPTLDAGLSDSVVEPDAPPSSNEWFEELDAEATGLTADRDVSSFTTIHDRLAGGACLLDVDGDGALDLFVARPRTSQLFRSLSAAGSLRYVDETRARGLEGVDAGGCLGADLDGDGDADLVTLGPGRARYFRNEGGSFVDTSIHLLAPFDPRHLYTAAVAFDADGDGDLDLAISSYGAFQAPKPGVRCVVPCEISNGSYRRGSTLLLLNVHGVWVDQSARLGTFDEPGLVLLATDLDADGRADLFVGNDSPSAPDRYFRGDGAGGFVESAATFGVAFNARKNGVSSMSAFDADLDGDGELDLVQSSWEDDPDAWYRCSPKGCEEKGESVELFRAPPNLRWGQALVDLDDDGVLELAEPMGHVYLDADAQQPRTDGTPWRFGPLADRLLLWHRDAVSAPFAVETVGTPIAGRSLLAADLDADGDLDLLVVPAFGAPRIYRNTRARRGHGLAVALVGRSPNTRAVGARIVVHAGDRSLPALVHAGFGYRSSVEAPIHFGVGAATSVDIQVTWPDGARTVTTAVSVDRTVVLAAPPSR
jgi:enediyne biosynthesis protein E4